MDSLLKQVNRIKTIDDMLELLKKGRPLKTFKRGVEIVAINKMDQAKYKYRLDVNPGEIDHPDFYPFFTPGEMLSYGVFEGKYLNDCILEFPAEWFLDAIEAGKLSPGEPDVSCNYFEIKSRMSLQSWEEKGWIHEPDNRGWFQWYCRYWLGRRIPELDEIQIKRWRAFKRHYGQVRKNCDSIDCRPKQRQALLQWSYDAFVVSE